MLDIVGEMRGRCENEEEEGKGMEEEPSVRLAGLTPRQRESALERYALLRPCLEEGMKLTRFWRVPKRGGLSHEGERKRKNVRFFFTGDGT